MKINWNVMNWEDSSVANLGYVLAAALLAICIMNGISCWGGY